MKRLRFWCVAICVWFFLLYNTERFHHPINLASFIYALTAISAVLLVAFPATSKLSVFWLLGALLPIVLLIKMWLNYPIVGPSFTITITELCAISVTILLARQLGGSIDEINHALAGTLVSHINDRSRPFEDGQEDLFREIRRARKYKRPLALLAVSVSRNTNNKMLTPLIREFERDSLSQYTMAKISEVLSAEMKDCSIITRRNGHLVMLLPETERAEAQELVNFLMLSAQDKLGVQLRVGLSCFPSDEITFVSLLERAEEAMRISGERPTPQRLSEHWGTNEQRLAAQTIEAPN